MLSLFSLPCFLPRYKDTTYRTVHTSFRNGYLEKSESLLASIADFAPIRYIAMESVSSALEKQADK